MTSASSERHLEVVPDGPVEATTHDHPAEMALLGSVLLEPSVWADHVADLPVEVWHRPAHRVIADRLRWMHAEGHPIDPVLLHGWLVQAGEIDRAGGAPYLHSLIAAVPTSANARWYAEKVLACWSRRHAAGAASRAVQLAEQLPLGMAPVDVLERAIDALRETQATVETYQRDHAEEDLADALLDEGVHPDVIPTGLVDLDKALNGGFHPTQLIVVGARPGVGKSILGLQLAREVTRGGGRAVFVSLEMSRRELHQRLMAREFQVNLSSIVSNTLSTSDRLTVGGGIAALRAESPVLEVRASITLAGVRAVVAREVAKPGPRLRMLVVDYLQLVSGPPDVRGREPDRQREITDITRGLKEIAVEFGLVVVALSQLNRNAKGRRPSMTDLRESGAIEQDANTIVLMHREKDQHSSSPDALDARTELIIPKQRAGMQQTVHVLTQGWYARVVSAARQDQLGASMVVHDGGPDPDPDGLPSW